MSDAAVAIDPQPGRAFAPEAYDAAERLSGVIFLDGALAAPLAAETIEVIHPGDRSVIGAAPRCGADDVERAVSVAARAFADWRKVPARERGRMLARAADRLEERRDLVERLVALDTGNALRTQARPETDMTIDLLRLFAGLASELKGETCPAGPGILHFTTRDPLGVVGAIIPWNAPILLAAAKLAPALVAGNTIVLKAAEQAPLCVLLLAEILAEELPAGVLNVLTGYGEECGKPLVEHEEVRKVTFTGSCPVGQVIMSYAAPKLCPVTLELGGKNPNIILPDADLEQVIPGVVAGMRYTRQGQSCTAGSRVFVHESVREAVIEGVVAELGKLKLGNPLDEATDMGAIISEEQFQRTLRYMEIARGTPGVEVLCGGALPEDPALQGGYYYPATLLAGLPVSSEVCRDEIFGPVACVLPWSDFDQVMEMANDTPYGLAAAIWTRDIARALQFVERIEAGFVQVNQYGGPGPSMSYGGLKMSGLGKEYALDSMIDHFTCSKTVLINQGTPGGV